MNHYSLSEETKQWFFDLLANRCSLTDFENWLYDQSNLASELGEDFYYKLISFNYRLEDAWYEITKLMEFRLDKQEYLTLYIEGALKNIRGFTSYHGHVLAEPHPYYNAHEYADELLERFGGFHLNTIPSAYHIEFYEDEAVRFVNNHWEYEVSPLYIIASMYHGDADLAVGSRGEFYLYQHIDEELYFFADNLSSLFQKLLLGGDTPNRTVTKYRKWKKKEENPTATHPFFNWLNSLFK